VGLIQHVAVLTGKRGGYGAMKPLLRALDTDPEMRMSLIATDQHVNPKFGNTRAEIERDFKLAAVVDMQQQSAQPVDRARALGVCLTGMASALDELSPDLLMLYGDRGEVLAAATAAVHLRIPIAHLQGGDVSGNIDDPMRHAISKLAHVHYPSTETSADRLLAMGEEPWRVQVVGDNHVDGIVSGDFTESSIVRERLGIQESEHPIVVLYHPETIRPRDQRADMAHILRAVSARSTRSLVVYPCSDAGHDDVISAFETVRGSPEFTFHQNIDAENFWGLLNIASVIIGNSSCGLIESPYFGLPAVNVGKRQEGRASSQNVIHCEAEPAALSAALETALEDSSFRIQATRPAKPFGNGLAWQRIHQHLKSVRIDSRLFNKRLKLNA
jgi:GDP/UDP-N,N'-diacetylbacillosamine 2-epimerase (hydrolysing)